MPYIPKNKRLDHFPAIPAIDEGELNYRICREIDAYMRCAGISYKNFNAVLGVLSAVALELNRRFVAPYEDKKLQENGEVFHFLSGKLQA